MLNEKLFRAIQEILFDKYTTGQLFGFNGLLTTEKKLTETFKLKDHWVESFNIQLMRAESFKNVPVECRVLPDDNFGKYKHTFRNLLNDETREDLRWLGREKLLPENQYCFWLIPINVATKDEFISERMIQVIIPPVDIDQLEKEIEGNKQSQ